MGKQGFRALALGVVYVILSTAPATAFTPPRDGGALPDTYFRVKSKDARAYTAEHGWVQKAARLRAEREAQLRAAGPDALPGQSFAVNHTLNVPVLPGYFNDGQPVPMTAALLQEQLFTNNATGTIASYYNETSYGQLTVTGTVYSWYRVSKTANLYYGSCSGVDPGCSATGEFIEEILDAKDASIDFGQYDNDGPDNIPNSGDDDGFVDALVIVSAIPGGECGGTAASNFISHTWTFSSWPNSGGVPFETGDARAGGGLISIDDYIIAPAVNCNATAPYVVSEYIDIGVFCHELGHIMGLPDLYDANGGGSGIGHWGIMGSGNWNTPEKPAHMDAWCKQELGWVTPTIIGWQAAPVNVPSAVTNAVSYKLPFHDEKFRRSTECAITGSYSLYCGLTAAEASARGYVATGSGYGPNWLQTIERDFRYTGSGSVTLQYQFKYDVEPNYDFASVIIRVNGIDTEIASYTGTSTGTANISLTPFLSALTGTGGTYTVKFRVESDLSFDDADGNDPSTCGAFVVDNVSVNGGGVSYTNGFESSVDGWHMNVNETRSAEYWLVENRRKAGYDINLHGEGLLIWHVDEEILKSPFIVNRGTGGAARGLELEEAEGLFDLNGAVFNSGEAADPYPGTSSNTSFTSATAPNSHDNLGRPTQIEVISVGPSSATMSATMKAGDPSPQASSINPTNIDNDQVATVVTVTGSRLRYGATFIFEYPTTGGQLVPTSLEWVDEHTLRGVIDAYARAAGQWNLIVTNPDGQVVTIADALTLNSKVAAQLVSASIDVADDEVNLRYVLLEREPGESIRLHRADGTSTNFRLINDNLEPSRGDEYIYTDRDVEPAHSYTYLLESVTAGGDVRELHRGVATLPSRELVLDQNVPNPFNPATSIRFYLPARTDVRLNVYDVRGALVRELASGTYDVGPHSVQWDGTDGNGNRVASGFYIYRLVTDGRAMSRKMMLLK